MKEAYFQIRPLSKPDVKGIVLKVSEEGNLEIIAGENSEGIEFSLNSKGILHYDNTKYSLEEINADTANNLKSDYESWKNLQFYMGTDPVSLTLSQAENAKEFMERQT